MSIKQNLVFLSRKQSIVILEGPRSTDKLSLALEVFPGKQYVSLKDKDFRQLLYTSPSAFFMAFPNGAIIDEAQELEDAVRMVELHISKSGFYPGKFILIFHGIYGQQLTQAVKLTYLPPEEKNENPFIRILNSPGPDKESILKDALSYVHPSNIDKFAQFMRLCAFMNGKMLSAGSLASNCHISAPTAAAWLKVLEKLGIIFFLKSEHPSLGHPTVKKDRLYFYSSSLLCTLLGIFGIQQLILSPYLFEITCAYTISSLCRYRFDQNQTPNLSYYQERNGFEVSLLAKWKYSWAFDISSSTDALNSNIKNSLRYSKLIENKDTKSAVLYLGELTFNYAKQDWISFLDWGKLANNLNYYS